MLSILLGLFIASYITALTLGVATVVHSPAFQHSKHSFDLRLNGGRHVTLISSKPSIVWHEPEAYFPVRKGYQSVIKEDLHLEVPYRFQLQALAME
jgi:hypothetical protein